MAGDRHRLGDRRGGARVPLVTRSMIAVVGQSVIDRVRSPDGSEVERLGGSPVFAAAALQFAERRGVILTKGATAELRAPLAAFGLPVAIGEATASFVSELEIFGDG